MTITITGQVKGGKNNIVICRNGNRFPKKEWAQWRDSKVAEVRLQLPRGFQVITVPVNVCLDYVASDKRRRDMPAIIDAIFHVLEKAGFCADDTLIWVTRSSRSYSKENARAVITVTED